MPRSPDMPCAGCGKLMWRSQTSLPEGQAKCRECRRHSQPRAKRNACAECDAPCYKVYCSTQCSNARGGRQRGTKTMRICEVCQKRYKSSYLEQRTCGRVCGRVISTRSVPNERGPSRRIDLHQCGSCFSWLSQPGRKFCSADCMRAAKRRTRVSTATPTTTTCRNCGGAYTTRTRRNGGTCLACQKRLARQRRRATKTAAFVEPVYRQRIYERDRWRCRLCGKPVKRTAVVPHPMAPTLDHIIPLAAGGTHEPSNVQCAHFICNSIKSAGGGGEQLLLLG